MAKATDRSHANLIREMARETNRSSRSSQASLSPEPTISDFDPENEAIMSTQQLDNNGPNLPALRASAQKYNRFSRPSRPEPPVQSEPDYAINTSAIGRAFPDFSQGGTSSNDSSISIEMGRGARRTSNGPIAKLSLSREYSSNAHLDLEEDSLDAAAPSIGHYVVTATPPLRDHQPSTKVTEITRGSSHRDSRARKHSGLQHELPGASLPASKTKDYDFGKGRKESGDHGRTLAAFHARVRDENDTSQIAADRPPTIDLAVRNTRFAKTKQIQKPLHGDSLPTKFSSTEGLMPASSSNKQSQPHNVSAANPGTQQSFLLPDMPNMSELISGVFEDGTPVFPRHRKSRPSRFARGLGRADVNEISVPEDEQAIFLSLKLLQDKIAVLEKNQAENEVVIQELEQKNQALETENGQQRIRLSRRSDSALGNSDSDVEERKLTIEKNRLESSVHALRNELDVSNRKAATAEKILRTITQERDSAVSQLSVAYVTIKQLESENEGLREENRLLTKQSSKEPENTRKNSRESMAVNKGHLTAPQDQTARDSPGKSTQFVRHSNRYSGGAKSNAMADPDMFDVTPRPRTDGNKMGHFIDKRNDQDSESEASIDEVSRSNGTSKGKSKRRPSRAGLVQNEDSTRDLTYLSFLDSHEVAKLRRTLELERLERKQKVDAKRHSSRGDEVNNEESEAYDHLPLTGGPLPRKSSMKDINSVKKDEEQEAPAISKPESKQTRRRTKHSIVSMRSRRGGTQNDNMTSAFIVPDITIRSASGNAQGRSDLGKEEKALKDLAQHNGENCIVCKIKTGPDSAHENCTITIPKPVPVSERIPTNGLHDEEPTIRPSQAPGLALATVIKGLEDEITHLKLELAKYQALYNSHDPALSKQKRKSVHTRIERLLQSVDIKSDQIYALYDVLEGQKHDGQEMSEQEVEVTLQSVGIDPTSLHSRGAGDEQEQPKGKIPAARPWELSSEDEDDELPWEGIESTVETTKNLSARLNRRSAPAAA